MSTSTTNLHLTKPAANEHADIAIINANYDLIDEFAGTVVVDPDYVHTENNYTTTEKQKLAGLENYTLPTASSSTKGGVKVDNESISIDQSGTISAALSGLKEVNIDAVTLSDGQILKFDATSREWVNASGGSGHTILDDDGTALSQEDDLQFKGVYSADNSEDGVTEVNVYREMTKAEFDLLSDDEKKGFIKTTDEPDIASIVDGVFYDMSNVIVQRTDYDATQDFSYTATQDCAIFIEIVNIPGSGKVVRIDDEWVESEYSLSGTQTAIQMRIGQTFLLKKGQTLTVIGNATAFASACRYAVYGIQQGSKTVDYHEYSTDEKVIGKWIDGKTLYEKTIDFGSSGISVPANGTANTTDSISGIDALIWSFGISHTGKAFPHIGCSLGVTYVQMENKTNNASNVRYFTYQYTKTS